jgi:Peptidase family M23
MNDSKPPILPMSTPAVLAESAAGRPTNPNRLWLVIDWVIGPLLLLIGYGAYLVGMLTTVVAVLVELLVLINLLRLAWRLWRREVYFGLFKQPFAAESRRYWWPCVARLVFYLCCGIVLTVGLPIWGLSQSEYANAPLQIWAPVGLLLILAFFPAKRIWIPITSALTLGSVFMIWQFVLVGTAYGGEVTLLDSPMKGVCWVVQGGKSGIINHHYTVQTQRCVVDLHKVAETPEQVKRWEILPHERNLGEVVCSPCDGRIAFCEDGHPDNVKGNTDREHPVGNYVSVEIAPGKYLMLAHLMQNSIQVKPGDVVKRGEPLAKCGNSGNTSAPHVHMQIQSSPAFARDVRTFPMAFRNVVRKETSLQNVQVKRNDLLVLDK